MAVVLFEETPGLSGLDGINAAALVVLSPLFITAGFASTALAVFLAQQVAGRCKLRSRMHFAALVLGIVGLFSPLAYLDGDWLLLGAVELSALPAAFLIGPNPSVEALMPISQTQEPRP